MSSSLSVNLLIAAMRYMADTEDRVSLAFLALHSGKSTEADVDLLASRSLETFLPETYLNRMEELKTLPLYELQEELYKIFDLGRTPRRRRLPVRLFRPGDRLPAKTTLPTSVLS